MTDDPFREARERYQALPNREKVRQRAAMFVGSLYSEGVFRLLQIVLENSLAEFILGRATQIKVTLHLDGSLSMQDDGYGMPVLADAAGGEPGLLHRLTHYPFDINDWPRRKLHTPLFPTPAVACVNFLSSQLDVVSRRGQEQFARRFRQGIESPEYWSAPHLEPPGTLFRLTPDGEVFTSQYYNLVQITRRLLELACLYPGLRIEWRNEQSGDHRVFHEPTGIDVLLDQLSAGQELLVPPLRINVERDGDSLDLAWALTASDGRLRTYGNARMFKYNGWFLKAFQRSVSRVLRTWALQHGLMKPSQRLTANGIIRQLHAVFAFQVRVPLWAGSTGGYFGSPEAEPLAYAAGRRMMTQLVQEHHDAAARVVQRACRTTHAEVSE